MYVDDDNIPQYGNISGVPDLQSEIDLYKLCSVAAKIAYYNFDWRLGTLILISGNNLHAMTTFLTGYKKPAIITYRKIDYRFHRKIKQFVIFANRGPEMSTIMQLAQSAEYNMGGKFILICTVKSECQEDPVFNTLSLLRLQHVVLLKSGNGESEIESFTYEIFQPNKCPNNTPVKNILRHNCKDDMCFMSIYSDKLLNFHRCPFVISSFDQSPLMYMQDNVKPVGITGYIISFIAFVLNAKLKVILPQDENCGHLVSDDWTGTLGDVYNKRANVTFCGSPPTHDRYEHFQLSVPIGTTNMVWVTKQPEEKPSWEKLLNPLDPNLRIAIILLFFVAVLINTFTKTKIWRQIRKHLRIPSLNRNLLFYSWMIFLGMPITKLSKKMSFQIFVYTWIWVCFVIRSAYQGALIHCLKSQVYDSVKLSSIQDVYERGQEFGGTFTLREFYVDDPDIYNNWIAMNVAEINQVVDEIIEDTSDLTVAIHKLKVLFHLKKYKGEKQLHILPQKIVSGSSVLYFQNQSSLVEPINRIIMAAREAGIIDYIEKRIISQKLSYQVNKRIEPISIKHVKGPLILWQTGVILSIIYFIIEIVSERISNRWIVI